ncbi:MAG: O-antigen ligase family protein [Nannocystaceae bacterium]|nr:O-antigen ligase family protein [Nannocystaceae bacterium]
MQRLVQCTGSLTVFGLAAVGPALWIGGALPLVVPVFCALVLAQSALLCRSAKPSFSIPWATWLGVFAAAITFVQWVPWEPLRIALAPGLAAQVDAVLAGTSIDPWPGASVVPGETALAAAKLAGLTGLFVLAAQRDWRECAVVVTVAGVLISLLGFLHAAFGTSRIYGLYTPLEVDEGPRAALLTSFVNPNHQSSLLLLGLFAAAAVAVDQHRRSQRATDVLEIDRYSDRAFAAMAAVVIQLPALVLSLSRAGLVAFLLVAPLAVWLQRRMPRPRSPRRGWASISLPIRATAATGLVAMIAVVARHGAWAELATLTGSSAVNKLRLAREALGMVRLDLPLGVGRGSFVDLFAPLDSQPTHVVYTHVESIPAGLLVELGWLGGGVVIVGLAAWFAQSFRAAGRTGDATARRIALLGLAALAIQNGLDFGLQLLGVAAPAVVLAGGLTTHEPRPWSKGARWFGVAWLGGAVALAVWALPHTYANRTVVDQAIRCGREHGLQSIRMRPLDGALHALIARRAAEQGRWAMAETWAMRATERRPAAPDPWLIRGAALRASGARTAGDLSTQAGLARLHATLAPELVDYLLQQYPAPQELAAVVPLQGEQWRRLVSAFRVRAPRHADAVAAARLAYEPLDPLALAARHELAMRAKRPALALHHARLWRRAAPNDPRAHIGQARALVSFSPPRAGEARDVLEAVLAHTDFATLAQRGEVEEALVRALIVLGGETSLMSRHQLASQLLSRPATRAAQRRRERLVRLFRSTP